MSGELSSKYSLTVQILDAVAQLPNVVESTDLAGSMHFRQWESASVSVINPLLPSYMNSSQFIDVLNLFIIYYEFYVNNFNYYNFIYLTASNMVCNWCK